MTPYTFPTIEAGARATKSTATCARLRRVPHASITLHTIGAKAAEAFIQSPTSAPAFASTS
jgi:hypothetical protein